MFSPKKIPLVAFSHLSILLVFFSYSTRGAAILCYNRQYIPIHFDLDISMRLFSLFLLASSLAPCLQAIEGAFAPGQAPESYIVQPGDTLEDICDQLLDNRAAVPIVTRLNPQLKDPHHLLPGEVIQFYAPVVPTVTYVHKKVPTAKPPLPVPSRPKTKHPRRAPYPIPVAEIPDTPVDILLGTPQATGLEERIIKLPGLLLSPSLTPLCIITKGTYDELLIGGWGHFLCEKKEPLLPNHLYSVIRKTTEASKPTPHGLYWFVAHVQILSEDTYSVGRLERENIPIEPGDWIVPFQEVFRRITLRSSPSPTTSHHQASLVAFEFPEQEFGANNQLTYLDKGKKDGFSIHDTLRIELPVGTDPTSIASKREPVGVLQLIEVTETTSIGYIISATKEIPLGSLAFF